ncbi:MAG: DUF4258 domain-containing protein [Nitrosomonadales bacterium]
MVDEPLPFKLSGPMILRIIREIAEDSSHVIVTKHARVRMHQRRISLLQVLNCLKKGQIAEDPAQDTHGNWVCTVRWRYAGDFLKVAAAVKYERRSGRRVIVITVMYED